MTIHNVALDAPSVKWVQKRVKSPVIWLPRKTALLAAFADTPLVSRWLTPSPDVVLRVVQFDFGVGGRKRYRSTEFRQFLDAVEAAVPRHLGVHLIMDSTERTRRP